MLIAKQRKMYKGVSPNVDFYSGFVYDMLGIPSRAVHPVVCDCPNRRLECTSDGGACEHG